LRVGGSTGMMAPAVTAETEDSSIPVQPGAILAGKYRVARVLGRGGMGVVVEARHLALDERVALKFLLPEFASHPEASGRFLREARAAAKIKSEHVARVSDTGTLEHGEPYMVMEYLEGKDLSQVLETTGPMALEDAVDCLIQGCEAIGEAHSYGIVHRDIKPANLFLTKRPDGQPLVKVLDFGISKMQDAVESLTRTTAAMGSALYMSPEQMQQTRSVDHRTDVYALGVALFELLGGKQPYYADTLPQLCAEILTGQPTPLRQLRPELPDHFAAALAKAYARDRADRYQSVAEFVIALAPYAPPRSQSAIDSTCRLAKHEPVRAGVFPGGGPPQVSGPAPAPHVGAQGGTQVLGAPAPMQIQPEPYVGPASRNAAAAFAAGGSTNAGLAKGARHEPPSQGSKAAVIAAAVLLGALVVGGGIGAYFLKFKGRIDAASAQTEVPTARGEHGTRGRDRPRDAASDDACDGRAHGE
jgi:serine/threonine protein kinase